MKILLLLALVASSLALQAPVEYFYKYEARVSTGLQAAHPQFSIASLKADVRITMEGPSQGVVELHNIQVGDANKQVGGNGRDHVDIDYSAIPTNELEKPYRVFFRKTEGETVMEVPKADLLWVNNVRRGLINAFRIAPLMEPHSVQTSNGKVEPQSFSRVEETYAGRCLVSYTVSPAAECDIPQPPSQDVQHQNARKGPGGDQIKIKSEFYRVQTSIDYSTCIDRPVFLQTGAGNLTNVTSSSFREASSRSYVSQYILEGEPGQFRIHDALVESHLIFNPYGIESEKMMVISNQTLTLSAARPAPTGAQIMGSDNRPIKTWRQQAQSPYSRPSGYTPRWVEPVDDRQPQGKKTVFFERMTSGFGLDMQQLREWKDRARHAIQRADEKLQVQNTDSREQPEGYGGSSDGRVAQSLESAHKLIRALTPEVLKELDEEMSSAESQGCRSCQELFVDSLAVAGSGPSVDLLLQKIESRKISDNRTASIFFTLGNNIQSPESIPRIMRYVMSVDEEQHVLVSLLAKVNFALLARRLCISQEYQPQSHFQYMFGDQACKRSQIVSQYLPHLTSKIENSSKSWVKILNIFAAAELGARESLQTLKKVARGQVSSDEFVRFAAIHGMSRQSFDNSTRDQIWNILQPIAEDQTEDFRVRQVAYDTLLTWKPNVTFLHRMAYSSMNEPSAQIQSYIYWVLSTFAGLQDPQFQKESTAAQILLPITRYVNPSYSRAMSSFSARYQSYERAGEESQISWLSGLKSYFPREIYTKIVAKFGRFDVPLLQTVTFGNTEQAYLALRGAVDQMTSMKSTPEGEQRSEEIRKIHQALFGQKQSGESNEQPDIYYYLRAVRSSEIFLPLTNEMYEKAAEQMKHGQKSLYNTYQSRITKYFNPVEVNVILPLPVGLWSQIQVNTPTVMHSDMKVEGTFSPSVPSSMPSLTRLSISAEGMAKFITKTNTYAQVFAPWTNKTIMAVVDHEKSLSLPLRFDSGSEFNMPAQEFWMQLTPRFKQSSNKIPVVKVRNLPYTAVGKILPSTEQQSSIARFANVKWVSNKNAYNQEQHRISLRNTGLNAMIKYTGEPDSPFSQANVYRYFMEPSNLVTMLASPSIKNYELTMYQLEEESPTKHIGFSIRHIQKDGSQVGSSSPLSVPQSANQPIDITPGENVQQRESKIARFSNKVNDELAVRINFTAEGKSPKIYEVSAVYSADRKAQSSQYQQDLQKVQLSAVQYNTESQNVEKTCMVGVIKRPMLQPQSSVSELQSALNEQYLNSPLAFNVFQGKQCNQGQQPVIKNEGRMTVSSNRVQEIMKVTQNNVFLYNTTSEFYRLAVYDRLDLTTSWQNRSPGLKNYTMWAQDLAEGYLYPNIVKNHMKQNSAQKMVVKADRSISDNRADAWIEMEDFTAHAERIPIRGWFDSLTSFTNDVYSHRVSGRHSLSSRSAGNQCHIHPTQVKTFDGINYEKLPTSCKTVAAQIRQGQESILIKTFQEQPAGEQVVEIQSAIEQLDARITSRDAKINGIEIPVSQSSRDIKDLSGNVVAKILRHQSFTQITVPGKFQVVLKDSTHVMVKLDLRYKGFTQGLCGEFESQSGDKLLGPQDCLYTVSKSKQFAAAWVSGKSQCQESQMKPLLQDVDQYQPNCEKAKHGVSSSEPCQIGAYPIMRTSQNRICVSEIRTPSCRQGCRSTDTRSVTLQSKCWPQDQAPSEVRANYEKGYMVHREEQPAPQTMDMTYSVRTGCFEQRSNILSQTNSDVCFENGYRVIRLGSRLCVTQQQNQVCKESCSVTDTETIQVQAKCWNESKAPSEVRRSEYRGFTTSRVSEQPQFTQNIQLLRPTRCFTRG